MKYTSFKETPEMGLLEGATTVFKEGDTFWAFGDRRHCPDADIEHNITRMIAIIKDERLAGMSKDYVRDVQKWTGRLTEADWPRIFGNAYEPIMAVNPRLPIEVGK